MTPVTVLTANATADEYTDADYAEMFGELRDGTSLEKFCAKIDSQFSRAAWNNWELKKSKLTRPMKSELRVGVGLPPLPLTVAEAVAIAHPDAEVVRVGEDEIRRIILTGCAPLELTLNGTVAVRDAEHQGTPVISVTCGQGARRDKRHRLTVNDDNWDWLQGKGWTVNEAIQKLREGTKYD